MKTPSHLPTGLSASNEADGVQHDMSSEEEARTVARFTARWVKRGISRFADLIAHALDEFGRDMTVALHPWFCKAWNAARKHYGEDDFDDPLSLEDLDLDSLDPDAALPALDQLFEATQTYRSSEKYRELLQFIRRFPKYSPFNCFLLHMQRPSTSYVATPRQWQRRFGRTIKNGAHPLVILAPMSPVLFVFDASDTEGVPLPKGLIDPYETEGFMSPGTWANTVSNLFRDRIALVEKEMPRDSAGFVGKAGPEDYVTAEGKREKALYRLQINSTLDRGGKYATLVHELGHLYTGHLGTPDERWWPSRRGLSHREREFEAESVCYLVCERAGMKCASEAYLSGYLGSNKEIPRISLDRVLKAAGQIEEMGKHRLKPRKKSEQ